MDSLILLSNLLPERYRPFLKHQEDLLFLTGFAVASRYPGEAVDEEDANNAYNAILLIQKSFQLLI
jgi:hypothetical protein